MRFDLGGDSLVFEAGGDYPANRKLKAIQIKDRTAAGSLRVESLGIYVRTRVLTFNLMQSTDYNALLYWFRYVVNGADKTFTFTDEYGDTGQVKIVTDELSFEETSIRSYSGMVTLEYQE